MAVGTTATVVAKAAIVAVQNKDKIGKIFLYIVLGAVSILAVMLMSFMSVIQAFLPEGEIRTNMSVHETAIYKSISEVTEPFYEQIRQQMAIKREEIISENTAVNEQLGEDGESIVKRECNVTITQELNYLGNGYLIAYLMYQDGLDSSTANINKEKATQFLNEICSITVEKKDQASYIIRNVFLTEEEIVEKYFKDEEILKQEFVASCRAYGDFFITAETEITIEDVTINEMSNVSLLEIPLYLQYAEPWGSTSYGNGIIKNTGCGPTCLAMVLSYLKQDVILPTDVTAWTGNRYYTNGAGSSWSIFPAVASQWNIHCTNLGKSQEQVLQALIAGQPVIASMGPGTFTKGGHFIVLTGVTESGRIKVNDPNDSQRKNHKDKEFDISLIIRESKNFWSFE